MILQPFTVLFPLTEIQIQLKDDETHRFICNASGRRSRKTIIGKRKTLYRALRKPGRYFSGAPTRPQAKAIFWDYWKNETRRIRSRPPNESELSIQLMNGSEIHVVGLDQARRVEGQPWHGMHITEFADLKPKVWGENLRPLISDTNGWAYLDGVPDGRGDWYDLNLYAAGGALPETQPGVGAFAENPADPEWAYYHWFSEDVLPEKEIEAVKRELDEETFNQEYRGSFEGGEGLAYSNFSQANFENVRELDSELPIHIGMDFNFDPMCSIAAQEWEANGYTEVHVLEAFAFRNCDTGPACQRIIDHFGPDRNYIIYPDPACQSRTAHGEGGKTDLAIIRQTFQQVTERGSYQIKVRSASPKRKDRLNAVKGKIKNAAGDIALRVHPRCKHLVTDFQKVTREEFLNNNYNNKMIGHVSDALGYYIENRFPVRTGAGIGSAVT